MTHLKQKNSIKFIKDILFVGSLVTSLACFSNTKVITQDDILNSGLNNLGDIINELVSADGSVLNQFNNYGGTGAVSANLHNLGSDSVLVLLNGQRLATDVQHVFDFSVIPLSAIKQVVIKQGMDAKMTDGGVAGVINIITNSGYDGIQANAFYGISSRGDAETQNYTISMGKSNDRGSAYLNVEYAKNSPISAGGRFFSAVPNLGLGIAGGSSATPQGRFQLIGDDFSFIDLTTTPGSNGFNRPNDADLIPFTDSQKYNFAPENYLLTPHERKSLYLNAKYSLSGNVTGHLDFLISRRDSEQKLAATPLQIGLFGKVTSSGEPIGVGGLNPYNPFTEALIPDDMPGGVLLIRRRLVELGNRRTQQQTDFYSIDLGVKGSFESNQQWHWRVNYSRSENKQEDALENYVNINSVAYALSDACVMDSSCIPLDLFSGEGSIDVNMANYIKESATNRNSSQLELFSAELSGDLGELPAGLVSITARFEHKRNEAGKIYDAKIINKEVVGFSSRRIFNESGSYNADSFVVSADIPLLTKRERNVLDLSTKLQYDKYDFTDGEISGGLLLNYSPVKNLRLGLDYSVINQVPSIHQLFAEQTYNTVNISDPCSSNPALPGCPAGFAPLNFEGLTLIHTGGNNRLDLEKWDTVNFHINYTPESVKNLSVILSYYNHKTGNLIRSVSVREVLAACAYSGSLFCDQVIRETEGAGEPFHIKEVFAGKVNDAGVRNTGFELTTHYSFELKNISFNLTWDNYYRTKSEYSYPNYLLGSVTENIKIDLLDIDKSVPYSRYELPKHLSNVGLNAKYNKWELNYRLRYISSQKESCEGYVTEPSSDSDVMPSFQWCTISSSAGIELNDRRYVGGSTFHDISFSYKLSNMNAKIQFGVKNMFDKNPPLSINAAMNNYDSSRYNGTGRFWWLRLSKDF